MITKTEPLTWSLVRLMGKGDPVEGWYHWFVFMDKHRWVYRLVPRRFK